MKDPVEQAQRLLNDLAMTKAYMDKVSDELEKLTPANVDSWEELYEKEFELAMRLHSIHEQLSTVARRHMNKVTEFQFRRILQESEKIYKPLIVEM